MHGPPRDRSVSENDAMPTVARSKTLPFTRPGLAVKPAAQRTPPGMRSAQGTHPSPVGSPQDGDSDKSRSGQPSPRRVRDKWKRVRRSFYVLVTLALAATSAGVGRLSLHEREMELEQAHLQRRLQWLAVVEGTLLVTNVYFVYRGVRIAMLLRRIQVRKWLSSIQARMPFVRGAARTFQTTGRVLRVAAWPVRAPVGLLRQVHRQRAAHRAAAMARTRARVAVPVKSSRWRRRAAWAFVPTTGPAPGAAMPGTVAPR